MFSKNPPTRIALMSDVFVAIFIGAFIYGITLFGSQWRSEFVPDTKINLSPLALPLYALFSALRGLAAYVLSLIFTLLVGTWAAKSKAAEKIIIPILDILQSIPVLGFLPGLVLGLIAIFPHTNTGLELAAVIMIFTGQVWNMTFSFYSSLKSIPKDFDEASSVIGFTPFQRFRKLELPFSAVNLAWNSLMSMAGGWFFLTVCEAFTLGDQEYRLPGLGAYMAEAIKVGDSRAMTLAIAAMVFVIVAMDILIWRPVLAYVHRFRLEEIPGRVATEPAVLFMLRNSKFIQFFENLLRKKTHFVVPEFPQLLVLAPLSRMTAIKKLSPMKMVKEGFLLKALSYLAGIGALCLLLWGSVELMHVLSVIVFRDWLIILRDTLFTALRVFITLFLASLWAIPVGIWIGISEKRTRIAQPIIQVLASFPAPMLYPLVLGVFLYLKINFEISALFLMLLGVQWYVLFNVLAGALKIPQELGYSLKMMGASNFTRWRVLYLPSIFPALVTGWVSAAGGAWNASIVAEYLSYKGNILVAHGLGAHISQAAETKNFPYLAASLVVMIVVVIVLNRTLWARVYKRAQTRYRLDL